MIEPPPPAELRYLVEAIGAEATLVLIEKLGGTRLYVPGSPGEGSTLVKAIGSEAARGLARAFAGEYLKIPSCKYWRARVYQRRGMSYNAIALALGCGQSAVHRYLSGQAQSPQMALPGLP